jgi:hypothetical protein
MTLGPSERTHSLLAADIITAVRALAPEIQSRGDEIAALRRLPVDLVTKLKATGAFRTAMPKAWGGPEMTPREQCEVYEVLGAADASVAWCVKIGSDSGYFAAQLDEDAARTLYPDLDYVTAGQVPPNGLAERVDGGYRLSGHWTFGSGCTHAEVIATGFLVTENGKPVMNGGVPHTRIAFAPASRFEIIDTWHSTGLAGSGSNDYRVKDLFVPDAHTIAQDDPPRRSEPLYCYFGDVPGQLARDRARTRPSSDRWGARGRGEEDAHLPSPADASSPAAPRTGRARKSRDDMARRARLHLRDDGSDLGGSSVAGRRVAGHAPRDGAVAVIFVPRCARGRAVDV